MNKLSLIKWELKEINDIVNFLENNEELDTKTIEDTRESIKLLLADKSNQIELVLKEFESQANKCKDIVKFYSEKAKIIDERQKKLKQLIIDTMHNLGAKRIETETGSFTIRKNAPSLVIDDENIIPREFITIVQTEKIEKSEIKKAMKNGKNINGVHLETSESLLIK